MVISDQTHEVRVGAVSTGPTLTVGGFYIESGWINAAAVSRASDGSISAGSPSRFIIPATRTRGIEACQDREEILYPVLSWYLAKYAIDAIGIVGLSGRASDGPERHAREILTALKHPTVRVAYSRALRFAEENPRDDDFGQCRIARGAALALLQKGHWR